MAAIENLEIIVDIQIAEAIEDLEQLQDELQKVAAQISKVDARGSEGIDINTRVDDITDDLAAMKTKIEAFETSERIDIPMHVHDAGLPGFMGRSVPEVTGTFQDDMLAAFARSAGDLDFGGFNVPRGRGGGGEEMGRGRFRRLLSSISDTIGNLTEFDIRMSDIHNTLARLVPLLLVFLGVIPTAVAALASLAAAAITAAGALLAIGGLGLLGAAGARGERPSMEQLQEQLSQIVDSFWEAFAPLAEALAPVFEDALDGLAMFFEAIAAEGDALMTLVDEMRAFGSFVMGFFPGFLRTLSGTLEALEPIFSRIGQFIDDEFRGIMRNLIRVTLEAAPALGELAMQLGSVLMTLSEMGIGFARVASATLELLHVGRVLLNVLGLTDAQLGAVIGSLLVFATALALANARVIQLAAAGILYGIRALQAFIFNVWLGTQSLGVFSGTALVGAVKALIGFTASIIQSILALAGFEISAYKAAAAAATFWSVVTLGAAIPLLAVIGSMTFGFLNLADKIDNATSSLKEFDRVAGRTEGTDFNPYSGDDPAGTRSGASGSVSSGSGGGTTINYESNNDTGDDQSNLDKTVWRANRTTGDT
jgi:hypothetical protein